MKAGGGQQGVVGNGAFGMPVRHVQIELLGLVEVRGKVGATGQRLLAGRGMEERARSQGQFFAAVRNAEEFLAQILPGLAPACLDRIAAKRGHAGLRRPIFERKVFSRRRGAILGRGVCRGRVFLRLAAGCGSHRFRCRPAAGRGFERFFQGRGLGDHVPPGILFFQARQQGERAFVIPQPGRAQACGTEESIVGKAAARMPEREGLVAFHGLAGIGFGERAAGKLLKAFRRAEQGCGAVGPRRVGIVNGAEFSGKFFPRFAQLAVFFIALEIDDAGLGRGIAFFRGGKAAVSGIVAADHQQADGKHKGQWRRQSSGQGLFLGVLRVVAGVHCGSRGSGVETGRAPLPGITSLWAGTSVPEFTPPEVKTQKQLQDRMAGPQSASDFGSCGLTQPWAWLPVEVIVRFPARLRAAGSGQDPAD